MAGKKTEAYVGLRVDVAGSKEGLKEYEQSPLPKNAKGNFSEDNSVITQYIPPTQQSTDHVGKGQESALYQSSKNTRRSWASILCCMRPAEEGFNQAANARDDASPPSRRNNPVPPPYQGSNVLPPMDPRDKGKKCLVLDLDETLVHSSFKPVPNADYIIPVEIENKITDVYVIKRPWVDQFMVAMAEAYEVVVFTASLAKYADPLLDLLDEKHTIRWRLFRDSCCPYEGNYVKDLSRLGRELQDTIIIDNSPHSYIFQPENAVPIGTFVGDNNDQDLLDLIPFLLSIAECDDVRDILEKRYPRRLRMY